MFYFILRGLPKKKKKKKFQGKKLLKLWLRTTHSSILAWKIPWTEEPGGLQSIQLQRARHDWKHRHSVINTWVCSVSYFREFTFPALWSMESFNSFFSPPFNLILFFKLLYKLCIQPLFSLPKVSSFISEAFLFVCIWGSLLKVKRQKIWLQNNAWNIC